MPAVEARDPPTRSHARTGAGRGRRHRALSGRCGGPARLRSLAVRVALVHDWLTGLRGGEKVLDQLAALFPDADLYTLVHVPGATTPQIDSLRIHTTPLSGLPGAAAHYRAMLPLFPWAIERLRVSDCDLVVSVSHAVAKAVRVPAGARHVCYCLTPMRYVWDQRDAYLGRGLRRAVASPLVAYLRHFDVRTSSPERVSRFLAISHEVAARIQRHYGRRARVVYPPVDVDRFQPTGRPPHDFYLLVGGFVPYKREDIAIEAFRRLGRRLVVAGDGPLRRRLMADASPNVEFKGRVSTAELADLYARCRALIYPQEEDFGIIAVEAQAAGRPVIALGRGGARETVVPHSVDVDSPKHPTGVWFDEQTPGAIEAAVRRFERCEQDFDPAIIRSHAERFSAARFRAEMASELADVLGEEVLRP